MVDIYPEIFKTCNIELSDFKRDESPYRMTLDSNMNIVWDCSHGHHWDSTLIERVYGAECPYCSPDLWNTLDRFIREHITPVDSSLVGNYIYLRDEGISVHLSGVKYCNKTPVNSRLIVRPYYNNLLRKDVRVREIDSTGFKCKRVFLVSVSLGASLDSEGLDRIYGLAASSVLNLVGSLCNYGVLVPNQ